MWTPVCFGWLGLLSLPGVLGVILAIPLIRTPGFFWLGLLFWPWLLQLLSQTQHGRRRERWFLYLQIRGVSSCLECRRCAK